VALSQGIALGDLTRWSLAGLVLKDSMTGYLRLQKDGQGSLLHVLAGLVAGLVRS
jgi:hypothetical protein